MTSRAAVLIALALAALAVFGIACYGGKRRATVWERDYPDGLFVG